MPIYTCIYICIYICIETLRSVWVELYINICIQIYIYIRIIRQEQIGLQCIPSQALRWQVYRPCSLAPAENWLEEKAYHVGNLLGFLWYVLKMVCRQRLYIYIYTCICTMMIWKKIHCSCNIPEINPLNGVRLVGDVSLKWQTWKSSKNSKVRTDAFLDRSH